MLDLHILGMVVSTGHGIHWTGESVAVSWDNICREDSYYIINGPGSIL